MTADIAEHFDITPWPDDLPGALDAPGFARLSNLGGLRYVVYADPKSGSTAFAKSLQLGVDGQRKLSNVIHMHSDESCTHRLLPELEERDIGIFDIVARAEQLGGHQVKFATTFRNPVARAPSQFFQNILRLTGNTKEELISADVKALIELYQAHKENFCNIKPRCQVLRERLNISNIERRTEGFCHLGGDREVFYVAPEAFQAGLNGCLDVDAALLVNANMSANRWYGQIYAAFLQQLPWDEEFARWAIDFRRPDYEMLYSNPSQVMQRDLDQERERAQGAAPGSARHGIQRAPSHILNRITRHSAVFHIGAPKSGTSSIQRALLSQRDRLDQAGFILPDFVSPQGNCPALANAAREEDAVTMQDMLGRAKEQCESGGRRKTLLLSEEGLASSMLRRDYAYDSLLHFFENFDATIVIYVNSLARQVYTSYCQNTSTGRSSMSFADYAVANAAFLDFSVLARQLRDDPRFTGQLVVRNYEEFAARGDCVVEDFFGILGLHAEGVSRRDNQTMPRGVIEFVRYLRSTVGSEMSYKEFSEVYAKPLKRLMKRYSMGRGLTEHEQQVLLEVLKSDE